VGDLKPQLAFVSESSATFAVMQTLQSATTTRLARRIAAAALTVLTWAALPVRAQDATYPPHKPAPAKIEPQIEILAESVVQTQWPHTLKLVNAPENIALLNPGQCVRVGIFSTGDNRDEYLEDTKLAFKVQFAGRSDVHPFAAPSEFKQIKPQGGDFVAGALDAAGLKLPDSFKTMVSLGASAERWCAPVDASDRTATVSAEVESPSGHQVLNSSTIQIESFETGSKKSFKDEEEVGTFLQTYYRQANPARLLPVLEFLVAQETQHSQEGRTEITAAFLSAAVTADPLAARDFRTRIATQPPLTRALGFLVLRSSGYDFSSVLNALDLDEQEKFSKLAPLQDPFDLTPTQALFQHLDMMWAVFGATGQFKPVQTIAGTQSWRTDYDNFDKLRNSGERLSELTPSIVRGVVYTAAGWSLSSFQRSDPLVADYIDYMRASPDTSQVVKSELEGLQSNPAFQRAGGQ
jgi:hypothetical protein